MSWEIWGIIALACVIIETFTVDFTFLMLGGAALATAILAAFTGELVWQIIMFSVVAALLVFFARPWAKRHINPRGAAAGNVYAQVGRLAHTVTDVDERAGRVKIGGDVWSARTNGERIEQGTDVVVLAIDGVVAVVATHSDATGSGQPAPENNETR
ncbi:MAG: NfeD family protein [Actinomycetaceae bacterium]|jgi:membrane protein implicated in regulation of membrane protease activity|nr:NfeD family protein [Actinomycetaceae bacterium]